MGIWDLYFLSRASDLFWYHHWHDASIRRALYKENLLQEAELRKLEARVRALEAQKITRDPNFQPAGVDPEEIYSEDYLEEIYAAKRAEESGWGFGLLLSLFLAAIFIYFFFIRKYSTR